MRGKSLGKIKVWMVVAGLCLYVGGLSLAGCRSSGTPLPQERTVLFSWTPGTCAEWHRLYEVTPIGNRLLVEVAQTHYQTTMRIRPSTWVVSGVCDEGEYFSEPKDMIIVR